MTARKLRVAAVQMACELGKTEKNLACAAGFVEHAAASGATLVLLPELMPGGYTLTEAIWDTAEPFDGATTRWMKSLGKRLGVYIGTSFLEVEGEDFYNTFVLANPEGQIAGRVRKNPPASFEAYFFRAGDDHHWIDTPMGRTVSASATKTRSMSDIVSCKMQDRPLPAAFLRSLLPGKVSSQEKGCGFSKYGVARRYCGDSQNHGYSGGHGEQGWPPCDEATCRVPAPRCRVPGLQRGCRQRRPAVVAATLRTRRCVHRRSHSGSIA